MKKIVSIISFLAMCMGSVAFASVPDSLRVNAESVVSGVKLTQTTAASLGNTLQGRLPGLTSLQQSGQPGDDFALSNLYLRGRSSYISGQKMLVFIDGFEADINSITSSEVESVTLLKDAAALAIYGARGANGVIQIKTKRGVEGKTKVNIRVQSGVQTPLSTPGVINSEQYAVLYNQACLNDGLAPLYSEQAIAAYRDGSNPDLYPNVNWKQQMMRSVAPLTVADMSFTGGNQIVKYYVLLGVTDNKGFFKGTDPKKNENANADYTSINIRSNIDVHITKYFSTAFNFAGQVGLKSFPGGSTSAYNLLNSAYTVAPNAFPVKYENGRFGGNAAQTNPVGELLYRGLDKENRRNLQIVFSPKLDMSFLTDGLSLNGSVAYSNYMCEISGKTRNYARYDAEGALFGVDEPLTAYENFKTDWSRINVRGSIDYSRSFDAHFVDASAFALMDSYREYSERSVVKYVSFGGIATYSYARKYIAQVSLTSTGLDNYYPGHRFGFFPAAALGWVMSEEDWLKESDRVNYLKLRASVGRSGNNQSSGRYLYSGEYASNGSYLFGTGSTTSGAYGPISIANHALSWEIQDGVDFGIDARFFKGLHVNFDAFYHVRKGIVDQVSSQIPGFVGTTYGDILPYTNVGVVASRGFELGLQWEKKVGKDFEWSIGAAAWYAHNTVVEQGEPVRLYEYQYRRGQIVGKPFVLVADGLYAESDFTQEGTLVAGLPVPQYGEVKPGDIKYIDQNKDGVVDVNDGVPVGYSTIPEWNFTFDAGFKWNGLELNFQFYGVANRDIYLNGSSVYSFQNNGSASIMALDSWTPENQQASYPRLSTINFSNNYRTSTYWRRNGSFLRLKDIYLAYDIPFKNTRNAVTVYFNATNVFSVDAMGGFKDPESSAMVAYPLPRTFSLGLKYSF